MLDELVALLVRLVQEGFISEDEAVAVLSYFDQSGQLPDGWQLPLPIDEAIPLDLRDMLDGSLRFFANRPPTPSPDVAQARFMDQAAALALDLTRGDFSLKSWQKRMVALVVDYLAQQAQEAAQRAIDDEDDLFAKIEIQVAFLSRFADQAATGRLSDGQIVARSRLYAGEGRAIYYEQNGLRSATYGWVEDYIAVDDKNTCGPCSAAEAQGPYLPGRGPMPGRICLGRGYCRCLRLPRYDEVAYRGLGGT